MPARSDAFETDVGAGNIQGAKLRVRLRSPSPIQTHNSAPELVAMRVPVRLGGSGEPIGAVPPARPATARARWSRWRRGNEEADPPVNEAPAPSNHPVPQPGRRQGRLRIGTRQPRRTGSSLFVGRLLRSHPFSQGQMGRSWRPGCSQIAHGRASPQCFQVVATVTVRWVATLGVTLRRLLPTPVAVPLAFS
jgi:hypothetical protein